MDDNQGSYTRIEEAYAARGMQDYAFLSLAGQGGLTLAQILSQAAVLDGKYVYSGVFVRGERTNTPVANWVRLAGDASVPSCPPGKLSGLLVFDEHLYDVTEAQTARMLSGLSAGVLMLCGDKPPESISFPYDFEGAVATVDARKICIDVIGRRPPPYGATAAGLFAAATGAVSLRSVIAATRERFPGKLGEANVRAIEAAYNSTTVLQGAQIQGSRVRPPAVAAGIPLSEVPDLQRFRFEPLPGVSQGNTYISTDILPAWDATKCTCPDECRVETYCPESVIGFRLAPRDFRVDYEYCKGCGICAKECPHDAVAMLDARDVYGVLSHG